ncbi:hypothetical protein LWI28_028221 [Acer negundo]|uniref:Uncharacterized protein n=1 Tax=Acer negundo TaxID=4023 RepID=A0AAD5JC29_ACENE|nr:hypothetical protein LWI28_028221 [Acer negundo]
MEEIEASSENPHSDEIFVTLKKKILKKWKRNVRIGQILQNTVNAISDMGTIKSSLPYVPGNDSVHFEEGSGQVCKRKVGTQHNRTHVSVCLILEYLEKSSRLCLSMQLDSHASLVIVLVVGGSSQEPPPCFGSNSGGCDGGAASNGGFCRVR